MKGYFAIGVQGLSKAQNAGTLFRTAHAFGASFVFTVAESYDQRKLNQTDTSNALRSLPYYRFDGPRDFRLPQDCTLVGVELTEDAVELPSFRHPRQAAYILGPERNSLDPEIVALCDHVVKIPMQFCVNVAVAGAIVMYDRLLTLGRFQTRPILPGGPAEPLPEPVFGQPLWMKKERRRARQAARKAVEDNGGRTD
ncbi:RNA methyltransferase [Oceanibaculum pacificum]|uniref:rRNA methyltransferase n=1 Tax=Oceanibaculum pacificum TaxID=580166 RepID=A0A154WFQ2_9PROT|nr:RNA methyltransferase [Oceanibaculum pacificum]KZD12316.1 rRNA methyltransferase [Oceanibaculum pacificum]